MNNKFATTQLTADIRGKEWTATGSIVNPNMFNNTGIGVVQYLQAVTSKIAVGAELMYQQTPQIPGGAATVLSLCGRFTGTQIFFYIINIDNIQENSLINGLSSFFYLKGSESVWSGFAGSGGMGFCYYRRLNEEIQVGFEIENSLVQQQTNVAVGYQFDLPKANFSMKGIYNIHTSFMTTVFVYIFCICSFSNGG
jgi:mitochondrial import receptor subunit TOM40